MSAITAIHSRTAQLQGLIDSVSPGTDRADRAPGPASTPSTSGADFDATLARTTAGSVGGPGALAGAATTASAPAVPMAGGDVTVAGMSVEQFARTPVQPGTGLDFLQRAMEQLGTPYVWGGASPNGFDCSGLVQYVLDGMGVSVPRVARDQMRAGTEVPSLAEAQPGDLVVTRGGGHIGIYVGGDQMLHAPRPGENVKIGKIYGEIDTIRRVVPTGDLAGGGGLAGAAGLGSVGPGAVGLGGGVGAAGLGAAAGLGGGLGAAGLGAAGLGAAGLGAAGLGAAAGSGLAGLAALQAMGAGTGTAAGTADAGLLDRSVLTMAGLGS